MTWPLGCHNVVSDLSALATLRQRVQDVILKIFVFRSRKTFINTHVNILTFPKLGD